MRMIQPAVPDWGRATGFVAFDWLGGRTHLCVFATSYCLLYCSFGSGPLSGGLFLFQHTGLGREQGALTLYKSSVEAD